jgi:hypothetical protein
MYTRLHLQYQLFVSGFDEAWILSTIFLKNTQKQKLMKICPVKAELLHVGGRTDGTYDEARSRFPQFCERA